MATRDHSLDKPILESAKKEFLAKGFEKASLKVICENAGVTTGAVYKRYKDKEALFAAVVEETVDDLDKIVDERCSVDVTMLSDDALIGAWDMNNGDMMWWFQYLFEHYEGFVLLISCAETTRYANFQHDWVEKMTQGTYTYYEEAFRRGLATSKISRTELHILLTAFWATIYEPFIHGYTFEQMEEHCQLVCQMFDWYSTFGFKK
ncbi:MAG: TetR family transcriptional regulator [Roseburia sp.]